jgi:hypothetical protein
VVFDGNSDEICHRKDVGVRLRLCRHPCGKAVPYRTVLRSWEATPLTTGGAASVLTSEHGKAPPFRTESGKAASWPGDDKIQFCGV